MYDVVIIGCGVVGAAVAYELSKYKLSIAVLEKENDVAMGATKANSGIVHAGYDPEPGTTIAKLNIRGSELMEKLCSDLAVEYKRIGSLVLAFDEDDKKTLNEIYQRGVKNGVPKMELLSRQQVIEMEPQVSNKVVAALYAPSAAIISPWELCIAQAETAVKNGVELYLNNKVTSITKNEDGYLIRTNNGYNSRNEAIFQARFIINAAGVYSDKVNDMVVEHDFTIRPNRGEYYLLDKSQGNSVNHVIFQCPSKAGKGVLVSPTVHGNLIVGPNSEYVSDGEMVSTTRDGLAKVSQQALKSVGNIDYRQSIRNFAGMRAISDRDDFIIEEAKGAKNFFNIAGIKSPGLTASPAIAEMMVGLLSNTDLIMEQKESCFHNRKRLIFKELSVQEKADLIRKNPKYGRVICRCETITEGEIIDAINRVIVPRTIDGIKRRCGAGMGRCQGGFCGPRVQQILSRELGIPIENVLLDKEGTLIITSKTKMGGEL